MQEEEKKEEEVKGGGEKTTREMYNEQKTEQVREERKKTKNGKRHKIIMDKLCYKCGIIGHLAQHCWGEDLKKGRSKGKHEPVGKHQREEKEREGQKENREVSKWKAKGKGGSEEEQ